MPFKFGIVAPPVPSNFGVPFTTRWVLFIIQYHNSSSIKISRPQGFVHHTVSQSVLVVLNFLAPWFCSFTNSSIGFFCCERLSASMARSLHLSFICIPQSIRALDHGEVEPRQAVSPKALRPWTIPLRYSVGLHQ